MNIATNPCYKCEDRFVKDGHRCHETCEKYIEWRAKYDAEKQKIRDIKGYEKRQTITQQRFYVKKGDKE